MGVDGKAVRLAGSQYILDCKQEWIMSQPYWTEGSWTGETVLMMDEDDIRVEKILDIRRQLGEGRYCLAERLDIVIDRIIEDLQ